LKTKFRVAAKLHIFLSKTYFDDLVKDLKNVKAKSEYYVY